jgi:hypothetical protein
VKKAYKPIILGGKYLRKIKLQHVAVSCQRSTTLHHIDRSIIHNFISEFYKVVTFLLFMTLSDIPALLFPNDCFMPALTRS